MTDRTFSFLKTNQRQAKPRSGGLAEIRGPYYTPMGKRYLQDVLETMSEYVDSLKFAGGSFTLMQRQALVELLNLSHQHDVLVSTGGFLEYVRLRLIEKVQKAGMKAKPEVGIPNPKGLQKASGLGARMSLHESPTPWGSRR